MRFRAVIEFWPQDRSRSSANTERWWILQLFFKNNLKLKERLLTSNRCSLRSVAQMYILTILPLNHRTHTWKDSEERGEADGRQMYMWTTHCEEHRLLVRHLFFFEWIPCVLLTVTESKQLPPMTHYVVEVLIPFTQVVIAQLLYQMLHWFLKH